MNLSKGDRLQPQTMFSCIRTGIKFKQLTVNSVCVVAVITKLYKETSNDISRSLGSVVRPL